MVSLTTPTQMDNLELHNIADNLLNLARPNQESTASILNTAANNIREIRESFGVISNKISEGSVKIKNLSETLKRNRKEMHEFIHPPIGTKKLEGEELEQWKNLNDKSFLSGLATALFAIGFFSSIVVSCFGVAVPVAVPVISFIGLVISGVMYISNKSEMRRLCH